MIAGDAGSETHVAIGSDGNANLHVHVVRGLPGGTTRALMAGAVQPTRIGQP